MGGQVPLGAITNVAGREGSAKSQFAAWLTAQVTRGTLRGELYGQPRTVFVAATEDSYEHVIVPRMMAAGADLNLVYRIRVRDLSLGSATTLSLPADNEKLRKAVTGYQAALVVLDPMLSVIGARLDTHKNREVRTALDPLAEMAADTCVPSRADALLQGRGPRRGHPDHASGAFKDVPARSWPSPWTARPPGSSQIKNTSGRMPSVSESYRIVPQWMDIGGVGCEIPKIAFTGPTPMHVSDLLDRDNVRAVTGAKDFLAGFLAAGPRPAKEVIEHAKQGYDIAERTLMRAKKDLGIGSFKEGGVWMWKAGFQESGHFRY